MFGRTLERCSGTTVDRVDMTVEDRLLTLDSSIHTKVSIDFALCICSTKHHAAMQALFSIEHVLPSPSSRGPERSLDLRPLANSSQPPRPLN